MAVEVNKQFFARINFWLWVVYVSNEIHGKFSRFGLVWTQLSKIAEIPSCSFLSAVGLLHYRLCSNCWLDKLVYCKLCGKYFRPYPSKLRHPHISPALLTLPLLFLTDLLRCYWHASRYALHRRRTFDYHSPPWSRPTHHLRRLGHLLAGCGSCHCCWSQHMGWQLLV